MAAGCFYTAANGNGSKCQWAGNDIQHADDCAWALDIDLPDNGFKVLSHRWVSTPTNC